MPDWWKFILDLPAVYEPGEHYAYCSGGISLTGVSGRAFASNYYGVDEGYAWHHISVKSGEERHPAHHGNGNGGQLLLVLPQFEPAVMFTAGNCRQGLWNRERDDIVGEMIIPALNRTGASTQSCASRYGNSWRCSGGWGNSQTPRPRWSGTELARPARRVRRRAWFGSAR